MRTAPGLPSGETPHYGRTQAMTWCKANGVDYIFGLSGNRALHRLAYDVANAVRVRRAEAGADKMRPPRLRRPLRGFSRFGNLAVLAKIQNELRQPTPIC